MYFTPSTVDGAKIPAWYHGPPYCQLIADWLEQIAFADPGILRTMLEEWPKNKSKQTKVCTTVLYQAAMKHAPWIM